MEAYKLCAESLCNKFFTRKNGIRIGWINCVLFGLSVVILSSWAVCGILHPDQFNPFWNEIGTFRSVCERNGFEYLYLLYCLFMFAAGIIFIRGVKQSNLCKLLPFLILCLVGMLLSPVFMSESVQYVFEGYYGIISISVGALHVFSFIWTLTHYLQLRYTPDKFLPFENIQPEHASLIK